MRVNHIFDVAVILRNRRRDLKLRQVELAKAAGVSRGFISDVEHGKEGVEFGKVMRLMNAMNVPLRIDWAEAPPDWAKPFIKDAVARERHYARLRPPHWKKKERLAPQAPQSWRGGYQPPDVRFFDLCQQEEAEREAEAKQVPKPRKKKAAAPLSARTLAARDMKEKANMFASAHGDIVRSLTIRGTSSVLPR